MSDKVQNNYEKVSVRGSTGSGGQTTPHTVGGRIIQTLIDICKPHPPNVNVICISKHVHEWTK